MEFEQKGDKRASYGERLLEKLSKELTIKHGKGFSIRNLKNFRTFYRNYKKWQAVPAELGWTQICLIMKIDDKYARNFYIQECSKNNWSTRELDRQINSLFFERICLSRDKKEVIKLSKKGNLIKKPKDLFKDIYVLEFLDLDENNYYNESDIERKIIQNLQKFILEIGKGFVFVGKQHRITVGNEDFYCDLVFFQRDLRCFVVFEIKIGKFSPKDLGQLQFYVNYFDKFEKKKNENYTIGILLCASKNNTVVEVSLPKNNSQLFTSKYKLYLPTKEELKKEITKLIE